MRKGLMEEDAMKRDLWRKQIARVRVRPLYNGNV